jgi:hypothetical protein
MRIAIAEMPHEANEQVEEYESSDKSLCISLLALGYRPLRVEGEEPLTMYFLFPRATVLVDVNRLLTGDPELKVSLIRLWAAEHYWQMCLSQLRMHKARRALELSPA